MMGDVVVGAGLLLGALMVLSACWVWIKHQKFGTAGSVLCVAGVVLVGLSVYGRVSIKIGGVQADLETQVAQIAQRAELTSVGILELADQVDASQRQFVALTEALEGEVSVPTRRLEEIAAPIEHSAATETHALRDLSVLRDRGELAIEPGRAPIRREIQSERPVPR